jgi:hypothetical protein
MSLADTLRNTAPIDMPLALLLEAADELDRLTGEDEGRCRFNCRTAKENWIDGYMTAKRGTRDWYEKDVWREAENEWERKRAQAAQDRPGDVLK